VTKFRRHIGIVFQDRSSDEYLTGRQNLDFSRTNVRNEQEDRESKIERALDLLELQGKENIKCFTICPEAFVVD